MSDVYSFVAFGAALLIFLSIVKYGIGRCVCGDGTNAYDNKSGDHIYQNFEEMLEKSRIYA